MERKTKLIAEPGDRVEVREYGTQIWVSAEVEEALARWYRDTADPFTHYTVSRADGHREAYPSDRIRKPEQP